MSSNLQRALSLLAGHPDHSHSVTEVSRLAGISSGGASEALTHLHDLGLVTRERRGKLVLYRADAQHPIVRQYKILLTVAQLSPLLDQLRPLAVEIILFGSCAEGANTPDSDIDLYVVADNPDSVHDVIWGSSLADRLRPVTVTPLGSIETKQQDSVFYEQVMAGMVLWRRPAANES